MRGSVVKRGRTWSYVVDVGRDPVTGRRRQRWRGGYATKPDAERALVGEITGAGAGEGVGASALRLDAYLDQWFDGVRPALRLSTAKSYSEIIRWLGNDDPTTRRMMEGILATEEEHADDLVDLLGLHADPGSAQRA